MTSTVIVGGSSGLGRVIAERHALGGDDVVITSRTQERADEVAADIGHGVRGLALDLAEPQSIEAALQSVDAVDNLVITAINQFPNTLQNFNVTEAVTSVTVKLVGYTEVVRVLSGRFTEKGNVVLFGGMAKDRPYPASTMVTTFNGGVSALVRTLAVEIAPHRVNAIHPGVVGDSPKWRDVESHPAIPRTPIGRLVTMAEVADATDFLMSCTGVNAVNLDVSGGFLVM